MEQVLQEARIGQSLRFGIMCRGTVFPEWQARCILSLLDLEGVEPHLLIIEVPNDHGVAPKPLWRRLFGAHLVWNLAHRWLCRGDRTEDLSARLAEVPRISCKTSFKGKFSEYFAPSDVEEIASRKLDFILRFAFNIIRGDILCTARYGVWSFHHGDLTRFRGSPAGFWEIVKGDSTTGVTLQRLNDRLDGGTVLVSGAFPTIASSYARNRRNILFSGAGFPAKVCRGLLLGAATSVGAEPTPTDAPIYSKPGNARMTVVLLKEALARIAEVCRRSFWRKQRAIGIADISIAAMFERGSASIDWLPDGSDSISVDTSVCTGEDNAGKQTARIHRVTSSGELVRIEVQAEKGTEVAVPRVAARGTIHHLAFEFEGQSYFVPEEGAGDKIQLFSWDEARSRLTLECTLLERVPALDPTFVHHEGLWWMFVARTIGEGGIELHVYYAGHPRGPWLAHALNPVKVDVNSARPAGSPFLHNGRLIRPAQDCGRTARGRVVFQEIRRLSPLEYEEREVSSVVLARDSGQPTRVRVCSAGERTLVDGERTRFGPAVFASQVRRTLLRISRWR